MRQKGLEIHGELLRQFDLPGYGKVDLLAWAVDGYRPPLYFDQKLLKRDIDVTVVELKRGPIKLDHVVQICRYIRGVQELFRDTRLSNVYTLHVNGILVGKSIDKSEQLQWVVDLVPWLDLCTWSIDLESGIRFHQQEKGFRSSGHNASPIDAYIESLNPREYHRALYNDLIDRCNAVEAKRRIATDDTHEST